MARTSPLLRSLLFVAPVLALASCGTDPPSMVPIDGARQPPTADVAELEIRGYGVDRFTTCPPPGDLGQHWMPPLPSWTPPPPANDGGAPEPIDEDFISRTKNYTNTEQAIEATRHNFRSCYRQGLVKDPTQDGRVAIVLRIGPNGRVAKVEEYAACELAPEAISCMKGIASRLRFAPPANGSDTVTIPSVFTSRDGIRRTSSSGNDAYTAGAFVTIESARAGYHACEAQARRDHRPVEATGTFTLTLTNEGRVTSAHVDPWTGNQEILVCAAKVFETLQFAPPPGGTGKVIARLNFNPRQGTR